MQAVVVVAAKWILLATAQAVVVVVEDTELTLEVQEVVGLPFQA